MIKFTARISVIVCTIILLVCATAGAKEKAAGSIKDGTPLLATPFVVRVPTNPNPFRIEDKTHLAYELAITNYWKTNFILEKVEVLGEKSNTPLLTMKGDDFHGIIYHLVNSSPKTDIREIKGRETVVVFMWVTVADADVPDKLLHNLTFREEDNPKAAVLDRPTVEVNKQAPPIIPPRFEATAGPL